MPKIIKSKMSALHNCTAQAYYTVSHRSVVKHFAPNQKKQAYAFARSLGITNPTSFDVLSTRAPHHLVHRYKHLYS
jgi:hypothetical protein